MTEKENAFLQRLGETTRKRVLAAEKLTAERVPTPSIGLNLALNGGFGRGRTIMLWGSKSAGKSSLTQQLVGIAQAKDDINVGWIDAESAWDDEWAQRLGVDTNRVAVTRSKTISNATRDAIEFIEAGADIVVIDSISVLLPSMFFDKKEQLKDVQDIKQLGQESLQLKYMVNQINAVNENTLVIIISQSRNNLGGMFVNQMPTGGNAVKYACSTVIKLWASESKDNQIKGKVKHGDKIFEESVGRTVNWIVDFNKLGPQHQTGEYDFYYQGDSVGVDSAGEIVDFAERYGVLEKGGAWYYYDKGGPSERKFQGKDNAVQGMRDDPDLYARITGELNERIR